MPLKKSVLNHEVMKLSPTKINLSFSLLLRCWQVRIITGRLVWGTFDKSRRMIWIYVLNEVQQEFKCSRELWNLRRYAQEFTYSWRPLRCLKYLVIMASDFRERDAGILPVLILPGVFVFLLLWFHIYWLHLFAAELTRQLGNLLLNLLFQQRPHQAGW